MSSHLLKNFTSSASLSNFAFASFPTAEVIPDEVKNNTKLVSVCVALAVFSAVQYVRAKRKDVAVPAIGPSGTLTSYIGAIKVLTKGAEILHEGFQKYMTFKVPMLNRWLVIVNSPELIDEIRKAPDNKLSFIEATEDSLAVKYTLGPYVSSNHYHVAFVRSQLTRNLDVLYGDIQDEVSQAFEDNIRTKTNEWVSLDAMDTILQIVARTSNRVFVGLPLCRDKEFIEINIRHTKDVIMGSLLLNMVPDFLKGVIGELFTSVPRTTRRALKHMRPVIEYRISQYEKYGKDWPGKPIDMLTWLMDEGPDYEKRNVKALTQRILTLNFAALHTSSISFTHALLHLASRPQDVKVLREEVESIVKSEGWSKASLGKMRKIDSYIKEALRFEGIGLVSMTRKALVDYTLSDGTVLPAGTHVAVNSLLVHRNEANYLNPDEFDGFRFVKSSNEEDGGAQTVSTSMEFLPFGLGRHACPGRFFAANELKTMLAYTVLTYDVKLEEGEERPKSINVAFSSVPKPKARVLFKRRSTP